MGPSVEVCCQNRTKVSKRYGDGRIILFEHVEIFWYCRVLCRGSILPHFQVILILESYKQYKTRKYLRTSQYFESIANLTTCETPKYWWRHEKDLYDAGSAACARNITKATWAWNEFILGNTIQTTRLTIYEMGQQNIVRARRATSGDIYHRHEAHKWRAAEHCSRPSGMHVRCFTTTVTQPT